MDQITKVLPRSAWEVVSILENHDPLVELVETEKLHLGGVHKMYEPTFLVRKTIAEKLNRVADFLPKGVKLVVIEGYRSMQHQQESWDRNIKRVQEENPGLDEVEAERQTRLVIAKPHPLANHHCGGAVDVTLAYEDGTLVDMGSPYPSEVYGNDIKKKFPMFPNSLLNRVITKDQEANRKLLRERMGEQDFVWYPGEWWHYCWGDRMWAVYLQRTTCFYGPIEP